MDIDPNEAAHIIAEEEQKKQAAANTTDGFDTLDTIVDGGNVLDSDMIVDAVAALGDLAGEAASAAGEVLGEAASVAGEAVKVIGEIVVGILD